MKRYCFGFISIYFFSISGMTLSDKTAHAIGMQLLQNETGGKLEYLVFWNEHEAFPSFGIGHYIWYPAGASEKKYTETFPDLIRYLQKHRVTIPSWLIAQLEIGAPWPSRDLFYARSSMKNRIAIKELLQQTIPLQIKFCIETMHHQFEAIKAACNQDRMAHIDRMYQLLCQSVGGNYALVDYCNFKGTGLNPQEQHQSQGWGLLQVLELMPDTTTQNNAVAHFSASARKLLKQRADSKPSEQRWLAGWLKRVNSYEQFTG